ncbi:MAG: hypothetical protein AVDCRST_MAG18-2452, partial [uncultured Thermomicrobiales bacterium]
CTPSMLGKAASPWRSATNTPNSAGSARGPPPTSPISRWTNTGRCSGRRLACARR